jgi:hypothetical protein
MKFPKTHCRLILCLLSITVTLALNVAHAQPATLWQAFNDYRPGARTAPNVSGYDLRVTGEGGVLLDVATGAELPAIVTVEIEGADPDNFGANAYPDVGTPADLFFGPYIDMGNDGIPGVRSSAGTILRLVFSGLNPARRYKFKGTVSRGGNYNDRWSLYSITRAKSFVAAHVDGSVNNNIITKTTFPNATLETNQVALNTGHNKQGSIVGWDNIEPSDTGEFAIEAQQYTGPTPFGTASNAAYGYGFNSIYLAETEAAGDIRITENPPATLLVAAGRTATLTVAATSTQPITYQWQKAPKAGDPFTDIANATQNSYTTPALAAADTGSIYRLKITSGGATAYSGETTITVDATTPTLATARSSVNFNALYLTFSEAMNLALLADTNHYSASGGLTIDSAVALDPTTVRLNTSTQAMNTSYTITVNGLQDPAGNQIAANSTITARSFSLVANTVGLEIWKDITGGAIADLRNNALYPDFPTVDYAITTFDSTQVLPPTAAENGNLNTYGGRMRALLTPTETADYHLYLRGDDNAELRVSEDTTFGDIDSPDRLPDATSNIALFQEPGLDSSVTIPMHLEKGKSYAVQVLWKESNGGDIAGLAWQKVVDGVVELTADQLQPIASQFLSYYGPNAVVEGPVLRIAQVGGKPAIEFTGQLQWSEDFQTWTTDTAATSPLTIPTTGNRFYRAVR